MAHKQHIINELRRFVEETTGEKFFPSSVVSELVHEFSLRSREDYKDVIVHTFTVALVQLNSKLGEKDKKIKDLELEVENQNGRIDELEMTCNLYEDFVDGCRERFPDLDFDDEPYNFARH